jgi:hypothetical protein
MSDNSADTTGNVISGANTVANGAKTLLTGTTFNRYIFKVDGVNNPESGIVSLEN